MVMPNIREDRLGLSPIHNRIRQYRIYDIQKMFGTSLTEFLSAPRDIVEFLISEAASEIAKSLKDAKAAENDNNLNALTQDLNGNAGLLANAKIPKLPE